MSKIATVDEYIEKHEAWAKGLTQLRAIAQKAQLEETIKWSAPVYTYNHKNIIGFGAFKSYFGLWFFNGVFLKDDANVLLNAQEGKTKALRQWRFNNAEAINEQLVLQYINEAIANEQAGKQIKKVTKKWTFSTELQTLLDENENLKLAFNSFTPYKQKEFSEYISEAKRAATKQSRLDKITPMIFEGIGLHDKFRK